MEKGFSHGTRWSLRHLILSVSVLTIGMGPAAYSKEIKKLADHVPGEIVIKIRDSALNVGMRANVLSKLQAALGDHSITDIRLFKTDSSLHTVRLAQDKDVPAAIANLLNDTSVEFAEPNYIYRTFEDGSPNDPDFSKLWGMKNLGQADAAGQVGKAGADINVLPLWKDGIVGDHKTLVAVIDTGISWDHPDLQGNLYTNPGEAGDKSNNGKDDDGNGFIDDLHGWNFANNSNKSMDDHNHGSHCSGTIGAVGNNGKGVAGVNWNVSLLPIKFLTAEGSGSLEGAVNAINYARMMKAQIMSNSWGGGGSSEAMKSAIVKAKEAGILFVAAAGNDKSDNDAKPTYPASYDVDNIVSVAAIDNQEKLAVFSNWGKKTVHVAAPGVKILSTGKAGDYVTFSGTSMATPHVSGVAALLWSANPSWTYTEIKNRLIATSEPAQALRTKVIAKGRVNAYNAYHNIIPPSQEPDEKLWKDVAKVVESEHPYKNSADQVYTINYPGAKFIRIHFEKVDLEDGYDFLSVESKNRDLVEQYTGKNAGFMSDYLVGDTAVIHLKADDSTNAFGFKIDRIQVITE